MYFFNVFSRFLHYNSYYMCKNAQYIGFFAYILGISYIHCISAGSTLLSSAHSILNIFIHAYIIIRLLISEVLQYFLRGMYHKRCSKAHDVLFLTEAPAYHDHIHLGISRGLEVHL